MLIVGLTGGIGSGKSTVADLFAKLNVPILDTDIIAREVVAVGSPALAAIAEHFGSGILQPDNTLNRAKLRTLIFENPQDKNWLEALLHPLIRARLQTLIAELNAPYCIAIIPLLLENKRAIPVDRVLVVDTSPATQIERIIKRDHLSLAAAEKILAQQLSRAQRLAAADDVITNNQDTTFAALEEQVQKLHVLYSGFSELSK